jgi:acetyltransferase-like isoleucine patch superfamily enzyme
MPSFRYLIEQGIFVIRIRYTSKILQFFRRQWLSLQGMKMGKRMLMSKIYVTWPHQVSFKDDCILEHGTYFKYSGWWKEGPAICFGNRVFVGSFCEFNISKRIEIGDDTNIASGCRFIDHNHGIKKGQIIGEQECIEDEIKIGRGVWLGFNVLVLKGVEIGDGAVVAAGAVVTKSILPNEIWGGVPAKKIGERT